MAFTEDQQRALAIAKARRRRAEAEGGHSQRQPFGEAARAGVGRAASAALFGFGDEIAGAIGAPIRVGLGTAETLGEGYREGVEQWRGEAERFKQERPRTALGLDIAGAVGGGAALAKAGGARLMQGFQAAPIRTGLGVGAAEGALFGAGAAEGGALERIDDAAIGAAKGAAIGAGAGAASRVVASIAGAIPGAVQAITRRVRGEPLDGAQERAMNELVAKLQERGINVEEALAMTDEAIAAATPGARAFDVLGEPGVSLAQGAVLRGTGPAQAGLREIRQRAAQGFDTANEVVADAISGANFKQSMQALAAQRRARAGDAFAEAEAVEIPARAYRQNLAPFIEANKEALRRAVRIAKAEGDQDTYQQLANALQGKATSLSSRGLGLFLEGLSDLRSAAFRKGEKNLYRALREGEDRFLSEVEKVNPALLRAREMYAGDSRVLDAAQFGRDIFRPKLDPEDIADAFNDFTASEREAALIGVARAIRDRAGKAATDGAAISRFFRNPEQRERLRAIFPDDDSYNRFAGRLDALIAQGRANVRIDPAIGSDTASRQAGEAAITAETAIDAGLDIAAGGGARTGINMFRAVAKRLAPDDTRQQEEMARILFETPEELRPRLIRYLERQSGGQRARAALPKTDQAAITGGGYALTE